MRAIKKFFRRLISDWKSRPYVKAFKKDIEDSLGYQITFERGGSAGRDSIYKVFSGEKIVGMARLAHRMRSSNAIQDDKPYRRIAPDERIEYEWNCCKKGYSHNLTPKPLYKGKNGILVSCHSGTSYDHYFSAHPEQFWKYIMRANQALRQWHDMGVSHMDASLSNIVGDPELKDAWLIDFEYIPASGVTFGQQKAYDYLRLVESSYKFVPQETLAQCEIWQKQLDEILDDETRKADLTRIWPALKRVRNDEHLYKSIQSVFRN